MSSQRAGRQPLTKAMLLPLPSTRTQALSLKHHLALATIVQGYGNVDLMVCLLRAVYIAFDMRDEPSSVADNRPFQLAESALERCIARAEQGERWVLLDQDKRAIEQVLLTHDEQLSTAPTHRYLSALEKLNCMAVEGHRSPIPPLRQPER